MELNYNKPYQTQPGDSKVTTWLMAAGRLDCYCWGIGELGSEDQSILGGTTITQPIGRQLGAPSKQ